jgi:hypothetical protein
MKRIIAPAKAMFDDTASEILGYDLLDVCVNGALTLLTLSWNATGCYMVWLARQGIIATSWCACYKGACMHETPSMRLICDWHISQPPCLTR